MKVEELPNWPPKMGLPGASVDHVFELHSDAGTLKGVSWGSKKAYLKLTVTNLGKDQTASIKEDSRILKKLYALLKENTGRPLVYIGRLKISE